MREMSVAEQRYQAVLAALLRRQSAPFDGGQGRGPDGLGDVTGDQIFPLGIAQGVTDQAVKVPHGGRGQASSSLRVRKRRMRVGVSLSRRTAPSPRAESATGSLPARITGRARDAADLLYGQLVSPSASPSAVA